MRHTLSSVVRVALTTLAGALALCSAALAQEQLAIKGGKVVPVSGAPIDSAIILIRDGKIEAVGKNLTIPSDYRVMDAAGKVILPGFIEAHSSRGMDQANERNDNVPFLSVVDAIDPGQEYFEDCLRNGVTTVAIVPGNETMIGSQAAIIKTAGGFVDQMIVKRNAGLKISLKPSAARSRMSHIVLVRKELDAARDALQELANKPRPSAPAAPATPAPRDDEAPGAKTPVADAPGAKTPVADAPGSPGEPLQPQPPGGAGPEGATESPVDVSVRREALVRLLKGEVPAFIYCDAAMDVPHALKLTQDYKLKTILVLGRECYKAAKLVAESKLPVILDPMLVFWETDPRTGDDTKIIVPKVYKEAGVKMTFQVTGIAGGSLFRAPDLPPTLGTNFLWYQAATAVKYGLPVPEALEAITLRPAQVLGIESLAGSIQPGKDADLVILTGEPLKLNTWVHSTLVRGKVVYERDKDRKLQHLLPAAKEKVSSR